MGRPRRRVRLGLATLGALALIGAGSAALVRADDLDTPPRVTGASEDRPINRKAGTLADISARNTPSVARNPVDPDNLVVAERIDTPFFGCGLHVSFDGAETWTDVEIPIPRGEEPKCYAPNVAFDEEGRLRLLYVTLAGVGNTPNAVWLATSDDGGLSLSTPDKVLDDLAFQVQLTIDPRDPERLHLTWLQADVTGYLALPEPGNPILYKTSTDGGESWTDPVRVSDGHRDRVVAPSAAAGPDGELYVLYLDLRDDRLDYEGGHQGLGGPPYEGPWELVLARSFSDGRTWTNVVVDDDLVPTQRFVAFLPPLPSVAVDPGDGDVYAAFMDGSAGDPDVYVWHSDDRGDTFDDAARVNGTRRGDGTDQYLPRIAVAPGGRVDVLYYDRRDDPDNVRNDVSFQSSFDRADTFTDRIVLNGEPFSSRIGFGSERGMPELGGRLGLLSWDGGAYAVWTDTRGSNVAANKQNIYGAFVDLRPTTDWSEADLDRLRLGGYAASGLGIAALLVILSTAMIGRRNKAGAEQMGVEADD